MVPRAFQMVDRLSEDAAAGRDPEMDREPAPTSSAHETGR